MQQYTVLLQEEYTLIYDALKSFIEFRTGDNIYYIQWKYI